MLPTLADIRARTAEAGRSEIDSRVVERRGRRGEKCFERRRGPRVLISKVETALAWSIWEGDFSGCSMPGIQKARRR